MLGKDTRRVCSGDEEEWDVDEAGADDVVAVVEVDRCAAEECDLGESATPIVVLVDLLVSTVFVNVCVTVTVTADTEAQVGYAVDPDIGVDELAS